MIDLTAQRFLQASRIIYNDGLTALGLTPCRGQVFFIAALPKSGSTWLYHAIGSVPGINYRPMRGPTGLNASGLATNLWDDVSEGTFKFHPRFGCSVFKLHTRYSDSNWRILKANRVKKVIVLVRDLRDVAVSLFHHHRADAGHELYQILHDKPLDQGVDYVLRELMPEYVSWVGGWLDFADRSADVMIVRYEDLYDEPERTLEAVFRFYGVAVEGDFIAAIGRGNRIGAEEDLGANLRAKGLRFSTARKGGHGGWKDTFSDRQRMLFDQLAGVSKVMSKLGYQI